MFGSSKSKNFKGKAGKAPLGAKGIPAARKGPSFDPNDTSIEGALKHVLHEQQLLDDDNRVHDAELSKDVQGQTDAPLVRLVNSLLAEAVKINCSDIHIEPFESVMRIRYRIDGGLREIQKVPFKLANSIVSRLKIMADLDICEKRMPQDGSFKFRLSGAEADFRISTLPSVFGEKVVMRVMGTTNVNNDLSKIGIPSKQLQLIRAAVQRPDGMVLVTGPTGSGKTTTLYAALNELNDISVSVFTAEDPVEGTIPGVTQCQVNASVGYTFASILRSLLRQDPDVILVGEIRDQETAEISIKAALTGHLVLSTLHTNCSVSTISRLINMGIPPYLITSSINCIVAQRLVRKICSDCKQQAPVPKELIERLGPSGTHLLNTALWQGKGCPKCFNSGYRGRAPLYEVLVLTDELRRLILSSASREELRRVAIAQGMTTLREAGLMLVKDGITTIEEVLGITNEDQEAEPEMRPVMAAPPIEPASRPIQPAPLFSAPINEPPVAQPAAVVQPPEPAVPPVPNSPGGASGPSFGSRWKSTKPVAPGVKPANLN